jgi:hypothetical protein
VSRSVVGWASVLALGLPAAAAAAGPPATGPAANATVTADQVILQFKRADLQAALRRAPESAAAREAVQRALDALAQRHGVRLHYQQTLGVGSALVAVTPASAQVEALVSRLAADAELLSVELNARMTHFKPAPR